MSSVVTCKKCQARLTTKPEYAGRLAKCPTCGQEFVVPIHAGNDSREEAIGARASATVATPTAPSRTLGQDLGRPHFVIDVKRTEQHSQPANWWDVQLGKCGALTTIVLPLLCNGPALVFGLLGLAFCRNRHARQNALSMTILSGAMTAVGVIAIASAGLPKGDAPRRQQDSSQAPTTLMAGAERRVMEEADKRIAGDSAGKVLRLIDADGVAIDLYSPQIDYTSYSFVYTPDKESSGIRAYQGNGIVTIEWPRIELLTITGKDTGKTPYRLKGELKLRDGALSPVEIVIDSDDGLGGDTDLGPFSISMENIRSISPVQIDAYPEWIHDMNADNSRESTPNESYGHLIVLDGEGNIVSLREAAIDYTSYGFIYRSDFERNGLRVKYGGGRGIVTLPWRKIAAVDITDAFSAQVAFQGEEPVKMVLVNDSKEGMKGKCDLGPFSIRMQEVALILPVSAALPESLQMKRAKMRARALSETTVN